MMGSLMGRRNQYIQLIKVLYCKLLTNGKQLPAFPAGSRAGNQTLTSEVGGNSVTTLPSWPPLGYSNPSTSPFYTLVSFSYSGFMISLNIHPI